MLKFKDFIELIRVKHWYKNSIIFISLIFSFNLFNRELFFLTFLGFIALCFISSSGYIINDILDFKKDRYHPEKKNRPVASGKIGIFTALLISIILLDLSLLISYLISFSFLLAILTLFVFLQSYNFFIRGVKFLDIIVISINFVIRAISGTFIIHYPVSFWVILSTFFLSIFLVSTKRSVEVLIPNSKKYRPNFDSSDKMALNSLSILAISCVFMFFSVYSILLQRPMLLLSLPIALYISFLFLDGIHKYPEKIRNPEKFIFDKKIIISLLLWLMIIISIFYLLYN